jgi:hypothetical protein
MLIGSVDDLARAIGFDPGVRMGELEAAVRTASLNLVAELGTELDRAAVVDQFYIIPGGSLQLGGLFRTRLALSRGFVDGAVTLLFGSDLQVVTTNLPSTATVIVNAEKGEVVITGPDLNNQYISASYTAGFDVDPDDDSRYGSLPGWLTDVAVTAAMAALDSNSPQLRYDLKSRQSLLEAQASAKALQAQVASKLSTHARFFPSHNQPL